MAPVLTCLLLLACLHRAPDPAVEIAAAIAAADRAWDDRARGGLAPVGEALLDAWTLHREDPELGWRVVRLRLAEGSAATDPTVSRATFAEARAEAVACLDADPLFAQQRRDAGWDAALSRLHGRRAGCAAWGALAWVRWMRALGADAASLDLPAVDALLAATGEATAEAADARDWASGLVLATRPAWAGQDRARAAALLARATERDPASILRRLDWYEATGDERILADLRAATPSRPEDVGAWRSFEAAARESAAGTSAIDPDSGLAP
jgi:hypothetical protein